MNSRIIGVGTSVPLENEEKLGAGTSVPFFIILLDGTKVPAPNSLLEIRRVEHD